MTLRRACCCGQGGDPLCQVFTIGGCPGDPVRAFAEDSGWIAQTSTAVWLSFDNCSYSASASQFHDRRVSVIGCSRTFSDGPFAVLPAEPGNNCAVEVRLSWLVFVVIALDGSIELADVSVGFPGGESFQVDYPASSGSWSTPDRIVEMNVSWSLDGQVLRVTATFVLDNSPGGVNSKIYGTLDLGAAAVLELSGPASVEVCYPPVSDGPEIDPPEWFDPGDPGTPIECDPPCIPGGAGGIAYQGQVYTLCGFKWVKANESNPGGEPLPPPEGCDIFAEIGGCVQRRQVICPSGLAPFPPVFYDAPCGSLDPGVPAEVIQAACGGGIVSPFASTSAAVGGDASGGQARSAAGLTEAQMTPEQRRRLRQQQTQGGCEGCFRGD